jgi:translation initiation factor 3 subunit C
MNETLAKQKVTPKKMNATNARGLNAVKQRVKKNNKDYQAQIDLFRKDSDAFMESDEEVAPAPKATKVRFQEAVAPEEADEDEEKPFAIVDKRGKAIPFSPESIPKHLRAIVESRGRKNTDRAEQIKIMEELFKVAETPYLKIRVLQTLVSARFDLGSGTTTSMPLEHWKAAEKELASLLTLLEEHKDHVVIEGAEEWEDDDKNPVLGPEDKYIKVPGSVVSYIERLDDELTRSLQSIDPHTSEYIERLTDEASLYNIILQGLLYYETIRKDASLEIPQESLNRIIQRRLDHVYFKVCTQNSTSCLLALLLTCISPPKLSRSWRRTPGSWFRAPSIRPSHLVPCQAMPTSLSTPSATTCLTTARVLSVPVPCSARSTSWPCTTSTTGPAI